MFPEIFRDEVFRLETRRLWLRWPTIGDAAGMDRDAPAAGAPLDAGPVSAWRTANGNGAALHLLLVVKADQRPVGMLHLVPTGPGSLDLDGVLRTPERGQGYMTEAIQAAAHACFTLSGVKTIAASPAVDNEDGRGVLEHCGFTYAGSGMRHSRTGRGLVPCDHFRLDHATWAILQGWAMPGFGAYVTKNAASSSCEPQPVKL